MNSHDITLDLSNGTRVKVLVKEDSGRLSYFLGIDKCQVAIKRSELATVWRNLQRALEVEP